MNQILRRLFPTSPGRWNRGTDIAGGFAGRRRRRSGWSGLWSLATRHRFLSRSGVELDRFDDVVHFVGDGDGAVGVAGFRDATASEDFVEDVLVGGVVGDGNVGVFEFVSGEDTDDTVAGGDDPFASEEFGSGDAGGGGGFTAEAAGTHFGFGIEDVLVTDLADDAVGDFEGAEAFFQVYRAVDFDRAGDRIGADPFAVHTVVVIADRVDIDVSAVPADAASFVEFVKRVGAAGVDHGDTGDAVDQSVTFEFGEGFAEGAAVSEVTAGHDDPIGDFPAEGLEDAEHDRFLAFEPERVDAIDEVDAEFTGDLSDADHRVVEVAGDLDRQGTIVEGLAEFAVGDFAAADEDHRLHQPGGGAVEGEGGAGVAGAGAGGAFGAHQVGVGDRGAHPVVFKAARGIHPFVLEVKPAGVHADVIGDRVGLLQERLSFADGDHLVLGGERQEFVEPPHAAEADRVGPLGPHRFELGEAFGEGGAGPVVFDIEEVATAVAGGADGPRIVGRPAGGVDALLEREIGLLRVVFLGGLQHGSVVGLRGAAETELVAGGQPGSRRGGSPFKVDRTSDFVARFAGNSVLAGRAIVWTARAIVWTALGRSALGLGCSALGIERPIQEEP